MQKVLKTGNHHPLRTRTTHQKHKPTKNNKTNTTQSQTKKTKIRSRRSRLQRTPRKRILFLHHNTTIHSFQCTPKLRITTQRTKLQTIPHRPHMPCNKRLLRHKPTTLNGPHQIHLLGNEMEMHNTLLQNTRQLHEPTRYQKNPKRNTRV